jgi:NAD(P)-dependent dehydrogenase (short-subunit alcohol dehydrogenase family)
MKAIVVGATGTIGSAVVKKLEKSGYEITAASRNSEISVDIQNPDSIIDLLGRTGKVDAIVCAAGRAAFGEVSKLTDEDFTLSFKNKLLGQIKLMQYGLSYLNPGGTILLTGGIYAYRPMRGSAAIAMVNAALEGFVRAAALETDNDKKVIVIHPPLVAESAKKMGLDPAPFLTAEEVSEAYLDAINYGISGEPFFAKDNAP